MFDVRACRGDLSGDEAMTTANDDYLGVGIYSIAEAARLTGVSAGRVRRWLRGYEHGRGEQRRRSRPVWQGALAPIDGSTALDFLDLIELRFVDAFVRAGVSWPTLRLAHSRARELVHSTHPFGTNQFKTEGRHIFADFMELHGEPGLVDVCKNQHYFEAVLRPILKDLEFANGAIQRWFPLGRDHRVVLDPARSFGQPIVRREGVPTAVLARAAKANADLDEVCRWFDVTRKSLDDALAFEARTAA